MENFDKDRILSRIKKMLALANDAAATEGERDNALRMAHATLAKYNLSMAQVDATGGISEDRIAGEFELREYAWMRSVAQAIGNLFFCIMFYQRTQVKHARYVFVGKESNARTAVEMTRFILNSIDREGMRCARDIPGESPRGNYWRSFCKGAAARIYQRCQELVKASASQTTEQGTPGTALVLASVYQTEAQANALVLRDKMGIHLRTRTSRQQRPGLDGFLAGQEYGNRIQLHKQIRG